MWLVTLGSLYVTWAVVSSYTPRRLREVHDPRTGRRVGVANEPASLRPDPAMAELPPLFPDRWPWLHRRLWRFAGYRRRQLAALERRYERFGQPGEDRLVARRPNPAGDSWG